jgi:hypothetical protein
VMEASGIPIRSYKISGDNIKVSCPILPSSSLNLSACDILEHVA